MMNGNGTVVGIEHIEELTNLGYTNLAKSHQEDLDNGKIKMVTGDGRKGYPDEAPYDVIHVGAAAPTVPEALVEQLAPGGILMLPVGPEGGFQNIKIIRKNSEGETEEEDKIGVMYIPLCDKEHQLERAY